MPARAGDGARADGEIAAALRLDPVGLAGDGCGVHGDAAAALRKDALLGRAGHRAGGHDGDALASFAVGPNAELAA